MSLDIFIDIVGNMDELAKDPEDPTFTIPTKASGYVETDLAGNYKRAKLIGDDISGTQYDMAHVLWGDGARLPKKKPLISVVLGDRCERLSLSVCARR